MVPDLRMNPAMANPESQPHVQARKSVDGENIILSFSFAEGIVAAVKTIPGRRYDPQSREWKIPFHENYREYLASKFAGIARLEFIAEKKESAGVAVPQALLDTLKTRRYSRNTIRSYTAHFVAFMNFFSGKAPENLSDEDVNRYLTTLVTENKVSPSYQKMAVNALKFYYEQVLRRPVKHYLLP